MNIKSDPTKPKDQLKEIIKQESLKESQKKLWNTFIDHISYEESIVVLIVLKDNPNNLKFLAKNLEDKMKAMQDMDERAWKKIIEEEKEFIEG